MAHVEDVNSVEVDSGRKYLAILTLSALGVVFGDIGTSPLYAMRECFAGVAAHGPIDRESVLGILSLIFWSLTVVVSIKYIIFVMRADNKGEGGVLALMALASQKVGNVSQIRTKAVIFSGLIGAALLYGDGVITPAISVLSAVEGLEIATPFFTPYIIPITVAVLLLLFFVQKNGTGQIGKVFGPIMLVWFTVLGVTGIRGIMMDPSVIVAIDPLHGLRFLLRDGWHAFTLLGSVFLVVTGGEALYADMGHFGRTPIKFGWFLVAFPGLALNYFGQGALVLSNPAAADNPFFRLVPAWGLLPMVGLATVATVIASQALISGAFSLTRQAIQLGYLPRMTIAHTSSDEIGQIYVSFVNRLLLILTVWLVLEFRSSSSLASAYGIAVSTTMVITTILMFFVSYEVWKWRLRYVLPIVVPLVVVDVAFFSANAIKIHHGGWIPLLMGAVVFTIMTTWRRGRAILSYRLRVGLLPLEAFVHGLAEEPPRRVTGTAIFLSGNVEGVPPALAHHLEHNKVLHEQVVLLKVASEEVPHVEPYDRVQVEGLGQGFYRVVAHYGFMESPNIPDVLRLCREQGFEFDTSDITFFLGRETVIATNKPGMALWREELFAFMSRNAEGATEFFKIPRNKVIEIGLQVEI